MRRPVAGAECGYGQTNGPPESRTTRSRENKEQVGGRASEAEGLAPGPETTDSRIGARARQPNSVILIVRSETEAAKSHQKTP